MTQHPHPPHGAGKSSFDLIDPEKLFPALHLIAGETLVDLGCGEGRYTLPLAVRVGPTGMVYGADLWREGLELLQDKARREGLTNVRTLLADVSQPLPLPAAGVDLLFMATVLHDLAEAGQDQGALVEMDRLVKTGGRLAVIEFKKNARPPRPSPGHSPLPGRSGGPAAALRLHPWGDHRIGPPYLPGHVQQSCGRKALKQLRKVQGSKLKVKLQGGKAPRLPPSGMAGGDARPTTSHGLKVSRRLMGDCSTDSVGHTEPCLLDKPRRQIPPAPL